jgi:PHD/YefM family antitoxin component YafN of YafNO toxin-antitoxin module
MLNFIELREKVKLGSGEKQVQVMKTGKGKKVDVVITQKGNKFAVYINGDKLDDSFKDAKDAEKNANDFIKLMGEELEQ